VDADAIYEQAVKALEEQNDEKDHLTLKRFIDAYELKDNGGGSCLNTL